MSTNYSGGGSAPVPNSYGGQLNPDGTLKGGVVPGTTNSAPAPNHAAAPATGSLADLIRQAGFTGAGAATMYGIVMAESGGSATAHNTNTATGDNSYGLAQINMLGSMGPARLAEYGLTSNDQLFDPLTNLKVAFKMSGGGTHFGDWSTYNSGAYKSFAGQTGATVTSGGSGGGASGSGAGGPILSSADYKDALGPLAGLLTGIPALKAILAEAVAGGWATSKFQQAVEATPWYRQHNVATRELIALSYSDPAEYKNRLAKSAGNVSNLASQLGVRLNAAQLAGLAGQFIMQGWDQAGLQHEVAGFYDPYHAPTGQAATDAQQLKQTYADYGVPLSQRTLEFRIQQMLSGSQTLDTYKQNAIASAKSMYPGLSGQIDSGLTVRDIADPYKQQMGSLLELDPNAIGVTDPLIKKALQGSMVTANGKSTATATPLWQFEQTLRADPRWAQTQNAKDAISSALVHVGADMGFAA